MKSFSVFILILIIILLAAPASFAQGKYTTEFLGIIKRLTNWMLALLIAVTVAFIVYAAYLYLTSQGDVEKVKTANRVIIYAVVAIAVALLAYVFIAIIQGLVGPQPDIPIIKPWSIPGATQEL